jgi:hypothetical protein
VAAGLAEAATAVVVRGAAAADMEADMGINAFFMRH